ncbi:MAG: NADH-quinone oxidoreductase subunit L, partial [Mycobacterium sp.]
MTTLLLLTFVLPLVGAAVLLLGGRATDTWGHLLGCLTVIGSFVCGLALFAHLLGLPAEDRVVRQTLFSWVPVGVLKVDFGLQLDA